jgi:hypothetical protein
MNNARQMFRTPPALTTIVGSRLAVLAEWALLRYSQPETQGLIR